jgi:hypothetical protein
MAKSEADTTELDELSFRLYAERISKMPAQINGEASSLWAYIKAKDFLAVRDRIRGGEEPRLAESKLADASAPNLKKTHPHNLVSQRFSAENGGEAKVLAMIREIHNWLLNHPRSDDSPVAYDKFDWDVPTTNLARVLLPSYVSN